MFSDTVIVITLIGILILLYFSYKEIVRIRERVEMSEKEKKLQAVDEEAYADYVAAKNTNQKYGDT